MTRTKQPLNPALIDEYGSLTRELEPVRAKLRRCEDLARTIRSSQDEVDPEQTITLFGTSFEVILGPKERKTVLPSVRTIYKKLGKDVFLKVASVTLKALKEHIHPDELAGLTSVERSGPRDLVVLDRVRKAA